MFAAIVAVVLGLGSVAGAKYFGVFDKAPAQDKKEEPIKVLVAATNLFEGTTITNREVRLRALRPSELEQYKSNREKYMAPTVEAANFRTLAISVKAAN